jgi:hypothetical protein
MAKPSELHNELTAKFTIEIIGPILRDRLNHAEAMVIFESIIYAMFITNREAFKHSPSDTTTYMEVAFNTAIERFSKSENGRDPARRS